ncbi:hypothetical protein, partial [Streptomyces capoamus]
MFGLGGVAGAGAAHELVEGVGEVGLSAVGVGVVGEGGADVLPRLFVEGPVGVGAVDPWDLGQFSVGQAQPDLADVVGVGVDFPLAAARGDGGGLAAVWAQQVAVVGAVVQADAAFGDRLPAHRQQFQVIVLGQGHGHVAGDRDEGGPHLVRRQRRPGQDGMAQPFVRAVVVVDEPFVEEVLQLRDGEARFAFGVAAATRDVGAGVAGQVLAEHRVDRAEGALDDAFGGGGVGRGGL